jgi:hypothetical protein
MQAQAFRGELSLFGDSDPSPFNDLTYPDVYFTPGYGASAAAIEGGSWRCATWEDQIALPYVERRIEDDNFDAVSPYGYCGLHVASESSEQDLALFWNALRERWRATGLVTMFFRFSPMDLRSVRMAQHLDAVDVTRRGDTVLVPVEQGPDAAWSAMEGRARTAVRKAEKTGMTGRMRLVGPEDLSATSVFRQLYESTMVRVGSTAKYLFSDEYYSQLLHGLGSNLLMAEVCDSDGVVVACSLVMAHRERVHYHLAGSTPVGARMGANNLLVWTIIRWAAQAGKEIVHLGGGVTADDSLFAFKKSFGGRHAEFWTGTAVLDENRYRRLVGKQSSRLGVPAPSLYNSPFFPLYRAEVSHGS